MSKRCARPWDKATRRVSDKFSTNNSRLKKNGIETDNRTTSAKNNNTVASTDDDDDDHVFRNTAENDGVPFIEIGNIKYYSDRFYLNRTAYDDDDGHEDDDDGASFANRATTTSECCNCGAKQPLPLFDRSKLIQSLDLQAAILGTFSFDVHYLPKEFPSLFGPTATIPTLIMHGKKGWTVESEDQQQQSPSDEHDDDPGSEPSWTPPRHRQVALEGVKDQSSINMQDDGEQLQSTQESHDDICSILTQEQLHSPAKTTAAVKSKIILTPQSYSFVDDQVNNDPCMIDSNVARSSTKIDDISNNNISTVRDDKYVPKTSKIASFPNTVHFSEVQPLWLPVGPSGSDTTNSTSKSETNNNSKKYNNGGIYRQGVHHPKFMVLIETSGSIVVLVSTANFTRPTTTDATWIQRFPPIQQEHPDVNKFRQHHPTSSSANNNIISDGSDFGFVLADFLYCETMATRPEHMTALKFVQTYCEWKSLKILESMFDYSKSQVHLIPVVPGDYEGFNRQKKNSYVMYKQRKGGGTKQEKKGEINEKELRHTIYLYGRQRIQHIFETLCWGHNPSIPRVLLSEQDRLIFQPTSFGAEWKQSNMAELIRSYMICSRNAASSNDRRNISGASKYSNSENQQLLERMDVVWPTEIFVQNTRKRRKFRNSNKNSPIAVNQYNMEFKPSKFDEQGVKLDRQNEGYLFMSSDVFNSTDLSCLSQMAMFEPSYPAQQPCALVPHFKSVCRLFEGNDYRLRKDFSIMKCEEYFSWFLLTSACLSRGAQGEDTVGRSPDSDAVSYSNFELGVLFCSRLNDTWNNRVYCWKPSQCLCKTRSSESQATRVVHLPIPYRLRPSRYQDDVDEANFCETPYLHEIPPGTGCVGHMLLTPYGISVANEYKKAGL